MEVYYVYKLPVPLLKLDNVLMKKLLKILYGIYWCLLGFFNLLFFIYNFSFFKVWISVNKSFAVHAYIKENGEI